MTDERRAQGGILHAHDGVSDIFLHGRYGCLQHQPASKAAEGCPTVPRYLRHASSLCGGVFATFYSSYVNTLIRAPLTRLRCSAAALCASLLASFFMFTSLLANFKGAACSRRLHVGLRSTPARCPCSKTMRHLGFCTPSWSALGLCTHDAELGNHGGAAAIGMVDSASEQRGEARSGAPPSWLPRS